MGNGEMRDESGEMKNKHYLDAACRVFFLNFEL